MAVRDGHAIMRPRRGAEPRRQGLSKGRGSREKDPLAPDDRGRVALGLQVIGGSAWLSAAPVAIGPRHCGQSARAKLQARIQVKMIDRQSMSLILRQVRIAE
jgi:hypothetical protein